MTELPRYRVFEGEENWEPELDPNGSFVKWADVSSRLQQLEQENTRLRTRLDKPTQSIAPVDRVHVMLKRLTFADWGDIESHFAAVVADAEDDACRPLEAALAETREALQQLIAAVERDDNPRDEGLSEHSDEMQKARAVLPRVPPPDDPHALVPQS